MAWGVSRTLHAMDAVEMVTVEAVVACLGLERGDPPVRVAKTPMIAGAIANGYLRDLTPPPAPVDPPGPNEPADPPPAPALTGSGEPRKAPPRRRG